MPKPAKQFKEPQAYEEGPAPDIALNDVESHKIRQIGYCPETRTLAVTFQRSPAIYHYPDVAAETAQAFMAAESKGRYFGEHLADLPFRKYRGEPLPA